MPDNTIRANEFFTFSITTSWCHRPLHYDAIGKRPRLLRKGRALRPKGTLEEGLPLGMTGGVTQFSPSGYGWGEGCYILDLTGGYEVPTTVRVEY